MQAKSMPSPLLPTEQARTSGTPGSSAYQDQKTMYKQQADLANAVGGKKRGGGYNAPQMNMGYKPTGGPGQTPNSLIAKGTVTNVQGQTNAIGDNQATVMGGSKKKRGGNPNWIWGCYSGGKKIKTRTKRTKRRKTRRHKKTRRSKK